MGNFACEHCERTYAYRGNLTQRIKKNHTVGNRPAEKKFERTVKTGLGFRCDQCGRIYMHRRNLDRHVTRSHGDNPVFSCGQCGKSYVRSANLKLHKRTCAGPATAASPVVKRRRTGGVVPEFTVRRKRRSLGGASVMYAVDMQEADQLSALQGAVSSFQPSITKYHREHRAYKFQKAVDVVFHKAVDPAVITQPPVT